VSGRARLAPALKWGLGPLALAVLAAVLGRARGGEAPTSAWSDASVSSEAGRKALEGVPALAVANATWALGSLDAVKKMMRTELDRLPETEGKLRARVFLRFGIVDTNPDGQAAVFNLACASDASICGQMKEAAERETSARYVAPGNQLPLYFFGGHP
jgi:hypothetical protein